MQVKTKIVISANEWETRVGILEDDRLVEFYVEREESHALVGRVYKGRVENVVPGLRGAFVHIGLRKNGFLPLNEIPEFESLDDDSEEGKKEEVKPRTITINEGEEILVQVVKDPFAEKGARLTSYISIPGRYLVYIPNEERVGISRRIWDRKERSRLRAAARKFKSRHAGLIIRTVAAKASFEDLRDEFLRLEKTWEQIRDRAEPAGVPSVVYEEPSIGVKLVRDLFTADVEKVVLDSRERYEEVVNYLELVAPKLKRKVEFYQGDVSLLEQAGVEAELDRVFQKRLWLKSGGFITIDQTE
ncbi:ribonuclease E/G, partial [candidate division WOR-3 bacterium]|nr:ribonuclease E/G [candidate division WOR-3 bacterium]